jgi:hypothetical protein
MSDVSAAQVLHDDSNGECKGEGLKVGDGEKGQERRGPFSDIVEVILMCFCRRYRRHYRLYCHL